MATIRTGYWTQSRELMDYCTLDELKILSVQAEKELNKRMDAYLGKVDADLNAKKSIGKARAKIKARRKSKAK